MLKKIMMPKEVRLTPPTTQEVSEISPFAKRGLVQNAARELPPEDRPRLRTDMVEELGKGLFPEYPQRGQVVVGATDDEQRLVALAVLVKDLRWEEMESFSNFLVKRLNGVEGHIDSHILSSAMNEWQRSVLEPPEAIDG